MGKTFYVDRPPQDYIDKKVAEAKQKESVARSKRSYMNGGINRPNSSEYYKTL